MNGKVFEIDRIVRDGIESLPERVDLSAELPPIAETEADADLDEALVETFRASDPLASGRTA
ncbi:hypothetical protein [Rhizobium favelukesii]|uniref:Uncharacterized protein n=2 Tax=Rhizobium TaxID=379 RepID=W6RV85_9HYPH|nr:hypothetical protein [Rhizobium favelukesii]MCS0459243.1 hypothetical protein [Rhizobium favelukesii]CDM62558.1 hypothetical protein LPU83_pLPU83d_1188 [Rhizobium favelukesii]